MFIPPDAIRHVCSFLRDSIPLLTLCIFVASLRQSPASSIHEQPFSVHYVQIVFGYQLLPLASLRCLVIARSASGLFCFFDVSSFFSPDAIRHVCSFLRDSIPLSTLCIFVASLRQSPASSIHKRPFFVPCVQI